MTVTPTALLYRPYFKFARLSFLQESHLYHSPDFREFVLEQLQEGGPFEVMALAALNCMVLVPISQVKTKYAITVGYPLSIAVTTTLLITRIVNAELIDGQYHWFAPSTLLALATICYGVRLAGYVWIRDLMGWKPGRTYGKSKFLNMSRLKRVPVSMILACCYACLMTPVLYALRHPIKPADGYLRRAAVWGGVLVAWISVVLQAVSDGHKHACKRAAALQRCTDEILFVGPDSGLYGFVRHPNYLFELLFWTSTFFTGTQSMEWSLGAWIPSILGLLFIIAIMLDASRRLEICQKQKYAGQPRYEAWKRSVPYPVLPGVGAKVRR